MNEDGFLQLYCELQKIFSEEDLQELLIYPDDQQRFLVFHEKGMYVLENTVKKPFRYYPTSLLKPCSVYSCGGAFNWSSRQLADIHLNSYLKSSLKLIR